MESLRELSVAKMPQNIKKSKSVKRSLNDRNRELCVIIQGSDPELKQEALEELIRINTNLIRYIIKKNRWCINLHFTEDDAFQEGSMGLMRAAEKFDPDSDFTFSTYACFWIKQKIVRGHMTTATSVKLPVNMLQTIMTLAKKYGQAPGSVQFIKCLDEDKSFSKNQKHTLMQALPCLTTASLDAPLTDDSDADSIVSMIKSSGDAVEDTVIKKVDSEKISELLMTLNEREKKVICYRFGFKDSMRHTLSETALTFDPPLSRERIRQIEARALEKLKRSCKRKGFDYGIF